MGQKISYRDKENGAGFHYKRRNFVKLLKLAYRNLFRNKRRSIFAILIATSGCTALCIAAGYYSFSIHSLQELTIRNGFGGSGGTGHAQLTDSRFSIQPEQHTLEYGLDSVNELMNIIRKDPDVDYVMPRIEFGGLISNGDKSAPFKGYGVDVEKEMFLLGGLSAINHHLKLDEQLVPLKQGKPGIILGKTLANSLHAKIGDVLMIYAVTADGAINGLDAELLGVMATGVNETDKYYLLTTIDVVQRVLNVNKVSLLSVMFKNRGKLKKKLQVLENELKNYPVSGRLKLNSWEQGADFYISIRDIFNIIFTFMGTIILVMVLLSCWNIMNMTAMERIREIGTLRAIGLSIKNISAVFLLESFLIGITGVVIGLILQLLISRFINNLEIIMPAVPGMDRPYTLQVFGITRFHPFICLGIILAIAVSSVSSFLLIKRFSIIESLEHT